MCSSDLVGEPWMRAALLEPAGPGLPAIAGTVEPDLVLAALADIARPYEREGA